LVDRLTGLLLSVLVVRFGPSAVCYTTLPVPLTASFPTGGLPLEMQIEPAFPPSPSLCLLLGFEFPYRLLVAAFPFGFEFIF
jgi:hypothetical protein